MKKWQKWLSITLAAVALTGCSGASGKAEQTTAAKAEPAASEAASNAASETASNATSGEASGAGAGTADKGTQDQAQVAGEHEFSEMTLRFGTTSAEGTLVVTTMRDFADKVSNATGGKVEVQIFPSSQLGNVSEMAEQAQMGALDMCMNQPANLSDMGVERMGVLGLPYLFSSYEQRWNVLFGETGNSLLQDITDSDTQLVGLGYYPDGARNFFTVDKKPIRKLEDVKGMKLRVQSYKVDNDMAIALGASPTPTSSSEMYSAIQSGIVDGAEQPVAAYYNNKFYEVSKYLTLDEHTYNTLVIIFSKPIWNNLEPELQAVLSNSWMEAVEEAKPEILKAEKEYLTKIADAGVEIIELSDKDKWAAAMDPVYRDNAADLTDLVESIKAVKE